jgi:hypothetical protein
MRVFRYKGFAYRQATELDAPWIVSFVTTAEQLRQWVGIPRRSERGLVGFQRLDEDSRVERAKQFFSVPQNQSPTALIVGIHKPATENSRSVELRIDNTSSGPVWPCEITVNFDDAALSDDDIKQIIRTQTEARLNESENAEDPDEFLDEGGEEDEDIQIGEDDAADVADGSEIELGRSMLRSLLSNLDDRDWFELNREALLDYAKPATLIDGQHRLKGAELCERGIPFTVCALFDCPWSEQVFQFTVVNYTQKGIPDQFITANAALSLTSAELDRLEDRLVQAQVKVVEYEIMRVVNFDPKSPFKDLINLTARSSADKIGYKTMVRAAKSWYSGQNDAVQQILQNIYPDITGKRGDVKRRRIERWKEGDWGDFFKVFWNEVFRSYADKPSHVEGKKLWDVGYSNLMIAVVLLELQASFLNNLDQQDEEYFHAKTNDPKSELISKIQDRSVKFLKNFPSELFSIKWKTKSLNTGAGRTALSDCFNEMIKKKGAFRYANSVLVTGRMEGAG